MAVGALDAGAALGAAALVVSVAGFMAQTAPGVADVAAAAPGTRTAEDLRLAELTTGSVVVGAGAVAGLLMRRWWPFLLTVAAVGGAMGLYECLLRYQHRAPAEG
jgi:hypothetical protein